MQFRYLNWYTQAIGSALGIMSCIFGYLNGYMFVFINDPSKYIDSIGILGVISSYTLMPLCILTLILALIRSYTKELNEKELFGFSFLYLNQKISILTIILGILGARHFFLLPAILILFNQSIYKLIKRAENDEENKEQNSSIDITVEDSILIPENTDNDLELVKLKD